MRGNDRKGLVIQERDRHLLREVALMRVADREQLKIVAGFGSTTRVNARLLALTRAGLLKRFFVGSIANGRKAVYTLSKTGAVSIHAVARGPRRRNDECVPYDSYIDHRLAINEVYCALKSRRFSAHLRLVSWRDFYVPLTSGLPLVPDGYIEAETQTSVIAAFVEVDLGTERLRVWKAKAQNYLQLALSEYFPREFRQSQFRVLVIASSNARLNSIRGTVATITKKIFWFTTLASIQANGVAQAKWVRASGAEQAFM